MKPITPSTWAAPPVGKNALQALHAAEQRFPVSLIATNSEDLVCCDINDDASEVANAPQIADFDHLPVKSKDGIVGLLARKTNYGNQAVGSVMQSLNERILMAADASMLDFIEQADTRRFVFLVEHDRISGVATLSDLQKVEARPPIFLRITLFEILVTNWIRQNTKCDEQWLEHVSTRSRKGIENLFKKRSAAKDDIDMISVADLKPKLDAAVALGAFRDCDVENVQQALSDLRILRNNIAHASDYADDEMSATSVSVCLRVFKKLIEHFEAT